MLTRIYLFIPFKIVFMDEIMNSQAVRAAAECVVTRNMFKVEFLTSIMKLCAAGE